MKRGDFDRLVSIVADESTTTDTWGQKIPTEADPIQVWAAVKPAPGTERFQSAEAAAQAPSRFFMKWRADLVKPQYRILHDGKTWDIKSIVEVGRRDLLEVLAIARVDQS